jgi:hypothetical protein
VLSLFKRYIRAAKIPKGSERPCIKVIDEPVRKKDSTFCQLL